MYTEPLAYFISFRAHGTWLHGDGRGSVDRRHNRFGDPFLPASPVRVDWERAQMAQPPMVFGDAMRAVIESTIREVCSYRGWSLLALNARTNHVHCVVAGPTRPETMLRTFKAWATRRLCEAGHVQHGTRVWSRHGSTIYLFKQEKLDEKVGYVINGQ